MRALLFFPVTALVACSDDGDIAPNDVAADTNDASETSVEGDTSETSVEGDTSETSVEGDTNDVSETDLEVEVEVETTETEASETSDAYLAGCESLFAARIVEMQVALDDAFPSDCGAPLRDDVARLQAGGAPLCRRGETANGCRERHYANPSIEGLNEACWDASAPRGCMRGTFVPRCADGSDDCVEPEAVCQDGTRPMVYREAAATPSNRWFIYLGGEGGPCTGGQCWLYYRYGPQLDDVPHAAAMSTAHPDLPTRAAAMGTGVMSGAAQSPLAAMNRVQFERCTDAASDAIEAVPVSDGVPPEFASRFPTLPVATRTATVPVWHRGLATWRATLHHLTTVAGRDRDGDGVPELPSLADATQVVFGGSSDAASWLMHAGDRLAEEVRAIAGDDVDVRLMLDGNFAPMLDNEGRYHPDAPADFDMYHDDYEASGLCRLPDNGDGIDNEACSAAAYKEGGASARAFTTRNVFLDASCEALHGPRAWQCNDREHVLAHHVATPFLVLADQEDVTISGNGPQYREDQSYGWDEPATYRRRVLDRAYDMETFWGTDAREDGPGTPGAMALLLPKARREGQAWGQARHVRFSSDDEMGKGMTVCSSAGNKIETVSFGQMLAAWLGITALDRPIALLAEDAARELPTGNVWVTGGQCRQPE